MKVMLLTAGEGTRFRPHTRVLPKPAIPALNIPLSYYPLFLLKNFSSLEIVANTFHLPEKIVDCLTPLKNSMKSLNFSPEEKLLGSGGGLFHAKKYFQNEKNFILMNGDEIILPHSANELNSALQTHEKKDALSTLVVMDHPEIGTKFGAVWLDKNNKVIGFGKAKPETASQGYHFIGVQFLSQRIFNYLPHGESNILTDGLMNGLKAGETVQIHKINAAWFETGNLQDFLLANQLCLKLLKSGNELLSAMTKMHAKNSELIENSKGIFFIDSSAKVNVNQLSGFAVIGANAKISPTVQIKNSVIGANAIVNENIEESLILS